MTQKWLSKAQKLKKYTVSLRRDFHQHPELGFEEQRTAKIVAKELKNFGFDVHTDIAQTGVVGVLKGTKPGKTIMLRFDMDALPIQEENLVEYASEVPGVMHACGHDGHTAIGLTTAKLLSKHIDDIEGRVICIFQPAEEGITGAKGAPAMIKAGLLDDYKPDSIVGVHLWNYKPFGWISLTPGPIMASIDFFKINICGKGGHAAAPHENIDPLPAACELVSALQSIVSRNVPPVDSAVVSVTKIHAGESPNVTPSEVSLDGTIRAFDPQIRERVAERMIRMADGISRTYQCSFGFELYGSNPAVINDNSLTKRILSHASKEFPDWEFDSNYRTMLSEDFAAYQEHVPGCFLLVGSSSVKKGLIEAHHSPRFDFNEDALPIAAALLVSTAVDFLSC